MKWFLAFIFYLAPIWAHGSDSSCAVISSHDLEPQKLAPNLVQMFTIPLRETGNFEFSLGDITAYYNSHPLTAGVIQLSNDVPGDMVSSRYKVNERGDFQAKNWHDVLPNVSTWQQAWDFNLPKFLANNKSISLVDASWKFHSALHFKVETPIRWYQPVGHRSDVYHYERTSYPLMKEWGNLPYPPLMELADEQVPLVNHRFTPEGPSTEEISSSKMNTPEFHRKMDQVSGSELTVGNKMEILLDNKSTKKKNELIKKAKRKIYVSTLVFIDDPATQEIVDLLIARHREGLDVRIIESDGPLAKLHKEVKNRFKAAGVPIVVADEFYKHSIMTVYHTKIVAIDDTEVIMGGQNMMDPELASEGTNFKNRDADIYIRGPGATDVIANFIKDWNRFINEGTARWPQPLIPQEDIDAIEALKAQERIDGLRGSDNYEVWFSSLPSLPSGMGRFIGQSPWDNIDSITNAHLMYLEEVKKYFLLTTPHLFERRTEGSPRHWLYRTTRTPFRNFNRLYDAFKKLVTTQPGFHFDLLTNGFDFTSNEANPITEGRVRQYIREGRIFRSNFRPTGLGAPIWINRVIFPNAYQIIQDVWLPHSNVRVWSHHSYLHSKWWLFDRLAVSIGSFNWMQNATDASYEATFITHDPEVLRRAEIELALDLANSVPFTK